MTVTFAVSILAFVVSIVALTYAVAGAVSTWRTNRAMRRYLDNLGLDNLHSVELEDDS